MPPWSRTWIYPGQESDWTPVPLAKLGAWYLLMIISYVLVTLVHRPQPVDAEERAPRPGKKAAGQ